MRRDAVPRVLAGTLALAGAGDWLMWAALVLFCLGLVLYLEALTRFDFRQIWPGAGDHWIASGALAISALAGSKLILSPLWTGSAHEALRTTTLVLLALALAWHAVLLTAEVARPRLHYDIRRWSTAFPMAITAASTLAVSTATTSPGSTRSGVPSTRPPSQSGSWSSPACSAPLAVAPGFPRLR